MAAMLKSPTDIDNYVWPEEERARFDAYMAGTEPLWEPPKPNQPAIGHNGPPKPSCFQDDVDAVVRIGPIVTSFK